MKEINLRPGCNIDIAWRDLIESQLKTGEICFGMFNDIKLLSTYTLDECYRKITGKTKLEWEEEKRKDHEKYLREQEEWISKIPQKTKEYINKAKGIIPENKLEYWKKIVPIRLRDLYKGLELDCWLDLIKILNLEISKEEKFKECEDLFIKQEHSGLSGSLVLGGLVELHPLGKDFYDFMKGGSLC